MNEKDIFGLLSIAQDQIVAEDKERVEFFKTHFNLQLNPFPELGVPETEVSDMAPIRQNDFKKIGEWVRSAFRDRKLRVLFIKGMYGSGKSFLLRRIVSAVADVSVEMGEKKLKIVYVYRPSFEAQALNRAILEQIGLDNVRKMTWNIIRREMKTDIESTPQPMTFQRVIENLRSSPRKKVPITSSETLFPDFRQIPELNNLFDLEENSDYRKFLYQFDKFKRNRKELRSYFIDLLSRGISNLTADSAVSAFVDLLLAYEDTEAWQTLLNINSPRRDRADFVRRFLQDLIKLLRTDGYVYLLVAIDEFEQITEVSGLLSTKEQAEYAYTMMEIINQIDNGLGLIISITEEGYNNLKNLKVPLADRVESHIDLELLDEDEIATLVSYYLDNARIDRDDDSKMGIFPFTSDIIKIVTENLRPIGLGTTPRYVVQFFHHLLEECFYNKITQINEQVIDDFVQHFRTRKSYFEDNTEVESYTETF